MGRYTLLSGDDTSGAPAPEARAPSSTGRYSRVEDQEQPAESGAPSVSPTRMLLDMVAGNVPGQPYQPPVNAGQAMMRVGSTLIDDLMNAVHGGKEALQQEGVDAAKQVVKDPLRVGQNLLAGVGELGEDVVNIPRNIPQILAHFGLADPKTKPLPIPKAEFSDKLDFVPGQPEAGDYIFREGIRQLLPFMANPIGSKVLRGGAEAGAEAMGSATGFRPFVKKRAQAAEKEFEGAKADEAAAKEAAYMETGKKDPLTMRRAAEQKQGEIENLQGQVNQLGESTQGAAYADPEAAEQAAQQARQMQDQAGQHIEGTQQEINQHIGEGEDHAKRGAVKMADKLEKTKQGITEDYRKLENNLAEKKVLMKDEKASKKAVSDVKDLMEESGMESAEEQAFYQQLVDAEGELGIPANDYVTIYRGTNARMRDAYRKGYQAGVNPEEQAIYRKQAQTYEKALKKMDDSLKESIGTEDYNLFKDTSNRWKKEVAVFYKNPLYHQITKDKLLPANTMTQLEKEGNGMQKLKKMAMDDPDIGRHVIGQLPESQRANLHAAGERVNQYVGANKPLADAVDRNRSARSAHNIAKDHAESHEAHAKEVRDAYKTYASDVKSVEDAQAKIDTAKKEIESLKKHQGKLQAASQRKGVAMKERAQYKLKMKKANDRLKYLGNTVKKLAKWMVIYKAGQSIVGSLPIGGGLQDKGSQ